jgi:V/A-type H+-transporting ATPase subunit E
MSLETVVDDIREEAEAEAESIIEAAEADAESIIEEAEADAESIIEEAKADVERQIEREREQRVSSANLTAKQRRLEARRDALETVKERVEAEVESLDPDTRESLTRDLLEAAGVEFEDADTVTVYCRSEDEDLLVDILEDYEGYELGGEYDCLGGVIVESEGSRIRVDNTFDSVLEEVWDDNLKDVSEVLFEEQ